MCDVHLVDKDERGDVIAIQQLPDGPGMGLYAIQCADDHQCIIQHRQRPFHLCGKIHMARRIQQRVPVPVMRDVRFFGIDGDPAGLFLTIIIQGAVSMIDPAPFADRAAQIQKSLAQRRLSRIHMSQQSQCDLCFPCSCAALRF